MTRTERARRFAEADLYVVLTPAFCAGREPLAVLDAVLDAGVRLVQFREKDAPDRTRLALGEAIRARTAEAGALLIMNDRVDLALLLGADGVHLGQEDLPLAQARALAPDLLLGQSTHDVSQAFAAQEQGADYVNMGPIFATQTKTASSAPLGPGIIAAAAPGLQIPFTVMGGIKEHNLAQVLERGARTVAVVTAVTAAPDVKQAAERMRMRILEGRRS